MGAAGPTRLRLLQLHPGRLRPDRHPDAPAPPSAQRSWLAAGNGTRIRPGHEKPGDLIFWDSYLGPNQIGHVMIVWNPATKTTIEARSTRAGIGHFSYANGPRHHIYEIWRVGNLGDGP